MSKLKRNRRRERLEQHRILWKRLQFQLDVATLPANVAEPVLRHAIRLQAYAGR
jgi:hypothetical protein